MKELWKSNKKDIIWFAIALLFGTVVATESIILLEGESLFSKLGLYAALIAMIGFGALWIFVIAEVIKTLIKKINEKYVVWIFTGAYIVIVTTLGLMEYEYFVATYEVAMIVVTVILYSVFASTMIGIYTVKEKTIKLTISMTVALILMFMYNIMWTMQIDFFSYVTAGIVQGYTLTKVLCKLTNNNKKSVQVIGTIGLSVFWICSFLITYGGYAVPETAIRLAKAIKDNYITLAPNTLMRDEIFIIAYAVIAIVGLFALSKVLNIGKVKERCFSPAYEACWLYLIVRNVVIVWLTLAMGNVSDVIHNDDILYVDICAVSFVLSSVGAEYMIMKGKRELEKYELVSPKEVFGENVGEELIAEKDDDDSYIVVMKDENTGNTVVLHRDELIEFNSNLYRVFELAEEEGKILIVKCNSLKQHTDIEDDCEEVESEGDIEDNYVEVESEEEMEKFLEKIDAIKLELKKLENQYMTVEDDEAQVVFEKYINESKEELSDEFMYA